MRAFPTRQQSHFSKSGLLMSSIDRTPESEVPFPSTGRWRSAQFSTLVIAVLVAIGLAATVSCKPQGEANTRRIKVTGSDTMVNLAGAWAAEFKKKHPD